MPGPARSAPPPRSGSPAARPGSSRATAPVVWAGGVAVSATDVAAPVFGAAAGEVALVAVGRVGVLAAGVGSVAIAGFGAVAVFGAATLGAAGRAGGSISRLTLGAGAAAGGTSGAGRRLAHVPMPRAKRHIAPTVTRTGREKSLACRK